MAADGKFARIEEFEGDPVSDARLRYMNERKPDYDLEGRVRSYWVDDLADIAETIGREGLDAPWYARTAFWIRLHGVLHDIRGGVLEGFKVIGVDPATAARPRGSLIAMQLDLWDAIESLRTQFTDDELIYADYLRQCSGHPNQTAYRVQWSNKAGGKIKESRTISTIGREITVAQANDAIRRVLFANLVDGRINEYAIAAAFARRVMAVSAPLVSVMRRLAGRK
jgi:hypothetical protein